MGLLRRTAALLAAPLIAAGALASSAQAAPAPARPAEPQANAARGGTLLGLDIHTAGRVALISMRADGSGRRVLIPSQPIGGLAPAAEFSPDGRQVAYSVAGDIYVMPSGGGAARRIVGGAYASSSPSWSPDGRYIAYSSCVPQTAECDIFRVTVAKPAGSVVRLTDDSLDAATPCEAAAGFRSPAWSPRGDAIAVAIHCRSLDDETYWTWTSGRLAAKGGRLLKTFPSLAFGSPDWSPDGRWLAFRDASGDADLDEAAIYVVRPNGSGLRQLTPLRSNIDKANNADRPVWSPDGRQVAYARAGRPPSGEPTDLWVTTADGRSRHRVARDVLPLDWTR